MSLGHCTCFGAFRNRQIRHPENNFGRPQDVQTPRARLSSTAQLDSTTARAAHLDTIVRAAGTSSCSPVNQNGVYSLLRQPQRRSGRCLPWSKVALSSGLQVGTLPVSGLLTQPKHARSQAGCKYRIGTSMCLIYPLLHALTVESLNHKHFLLAGLFGRPIGHGGPAQEAQDSSHHAGAR